MEKNSASENPLSEIKIGHFTSRWAESHGIPVIYKSETESTNQTARQQAFSNEVQNSALVVYLCDQQTKGRGRGQNKWNTSTAGTQLLSTWSFALQEPVLPIVSPLIGLAVFRALYSTWPFLELSLKAPNDIYLDDKKIAGILLETITQGSQHRLIVGLGLNVLAAPQEIETAGFLNDFFGSETPFLAQDWVAFLERLVFELSLAIQESYEPLSSTAQANLVWALNRDLSLEEKFQSIDENGTLKTKSKTISWMEL